MTLKLNGTNSEAAPAYAGDDADTGLQCGTNELKLVTGGSARATVDSSGNLGVGTTTPSQSWTGGSSRTQQLSGLSGQITVLRVNEAGGTGGDLQLVSSTSAEAAVYNFANGSLRFGTNGAERMRILSGGGITFNGDTATANALDDYEEGDWTPTITFGGNNSGMGFTSRDGFYIKIGRQVTCWFQVTLSAKGSSTGIAKLDNFPFDAADELSGTSIEGGGLLVYAANISNTVRPPYALAVLNNTNEAEFITSPNSNEHSTNLTNSNFENNTLIRGYATYFSA